MVVGKVQEVVGAVVHVVYLTSKQLLVVALWNVLYHQSGASILLDIVGVYGVMLPVDHRFQAS